MATEVRNAMSYRAWLKQFKAAIYELAGDAPRDETDGYLNTCDFRNYYEEGLSPLDAAENDYGYWDY